MERFAVNQIWQRDGLEGAVIEVSDEGKCGVVQITDKHGNSVGTYSGAAIGFQGPGEWKLFNSRSSVVGQSFVVYVY